MLWMVTETGLWLVKFWSYPSAALLMGSGQMGRCTSKSGSSSIVGLHWCSQSACCRAYQPPRLSQLFCVPGNAAWWISCVLFGTCVLAYAVAKGFGLTTGIGATSFSAVVATGSFQARVPLYVPLREPQSKCIVMCCQHELPSVFCAVRLLFSAVPADLHRQAVHATGSRCVQLLVWGACADPDCH